jgi:hypothetical protein
MNTSMNHPCAIRADATTSGLVNVGIANHGMQSCGIYGAIPMLRLIVPTLAVLVRVRIADTTATVDSAAIADTESMQQNVNSLFHMLNHTV